MIRRLEQHEVDRVWSIDRSETVRGEYRLERGTLVVGPAHHDVTGWPPGEAEHYGPLLHDCFERGGSFFGAFEGDTLAGAAVLESRFIGAAKDQLQLVFLHVSRRSRGSGTGRALFEAATARAKELGAGRLYVSATPSENTIRFYLHRGCRVADEVDAELFAREPEDIHLSFVIP